MGEGAKQGAAWLGLSRIALQVLQFGFSIITARLLLPAEFGVAALALAIVAFAGVFADLGLAAAVVHARRATVDLLNTAFWLNVGVGIVFAGVVAAAAWPAAKIYGHPSLLTLMLVASLNFVLTRGAVQIALLERTFRYRRLAVIETTATAAGIVLVPIAAISGAGSLSLVLGPLLATVLLNAGLWMSVPWRPSGRPSRRSALQMWDYSKGLVGFNVLNYWARNLDTLLLGGAVTAGALGQYNRAFNLMMVPVQQMSHVLGRVLFPSLARLRDDLPRLGRAWVKSLSVAGALSMPIAVTFATTAPALVAVLYGPRWAGMVTVLELLSLSAIPQILASSTGSVYRAIGRTGLLFKVGLINTGLTVVAIFLGLGGGIEGVAAALLVKSWIGLAVAVTPLARILGIPFGSFTRLVGALVLPIGAMAAAQLAVRWAVLPDAGPFSVLFAQLSLGGAVYLAVLRAMGSPALDLVIAFVADRRSRRQKKKASA